MSMNFGSTLSACWHCRKLKLKEKQAAILEFDFWQKVLKESPEHSETARGRIGRFNRKNIIMNKKVEVKNYAGLLPVDNGEKRYKIITDDAGR